MITVVWDKLFKTYQKEEERPTYGITEKIEKKIDPIYLNFHEVREMIKDVRSTNKLGEKLFFIFASPAAVSKYKKERPGSFIV